MGWINNNTFSIGYAVGATPLQIHNAVSTIANFGILMQPQVINKITDKEGKTVVAFKPNAKRRVVSIDAARQMGEMMTGVVTSEGTARRAALDGFMVSGKTGTTRKLVNGSYTSDKHTASFSGFFPTHRPRVVISVIVDEPNSMDRIRGRVAAPYSGILQTSLLSTWA